MSPDSEREKKPDKPEPSRAVERLAQAMAPLAASLGLAVPGETSPRLPLNLPISSLSRLTGQLLSSEMIFRHGRTIITVDAATGERELMSKERFPSYVEKFATLVKPGRDGERVVSMDAATAAKVLASDQFRCHLRELRGVFPVRLPVWANPEKTAVRLAASGYDEETGILTLNLLDYPDDVTPARAVERLGELVRGYPWGDAADWRASRSLAVHVAAMLSPFVALLLSPTDKRPGILYTANQVGTGKTTLAKFGLMAVFGEVETADRPESKKDLADLLDTWAVEGKEYLFLDDVEGFIRSASLNNFMTSGVRAGRVKGFTASFKCRVVTQVIMTGNRVKVTPDLARRCLVVELFCANDAGDRTFSRDINETYLSRDDVRAELLSCLWALVRNWVDCGRKPNTATLPSFEGFSRLVGGIVQDGGFIDPIARPAVVLDDYAEAFRRLLCSLAETVPRGDTGRFSVDDCLSQARELDVLDVIAGDARTEQGQRVAFGKRMEAWKGREFDDGRGFRFRFGRKEQARGTAYEVAVFP